MTLLTVLTWSICRSLMISVTALPMSLCLGRFLQSGGRPSDDRLPAAAGTAASRINGAAVLLTAAALLPLFVPDLLTGFSYRLTAARLIHSAAATECLYAGLLLCRIAALQTAVRLVLPAAPVSDASLHSWKLVRGRSLSWWAAWLQLRLLGPDRTVFVALIAGTVLCFQDFETAALLQVDRHPITFTVWLFDAHFAGEPLSRSLNFVAGSLLFQLALLAPVVVVLTGRGMPTIQQSPLSPPAGRRWRLPAVAVIGLSVWVVCVWPLLAGAGGIGDGLAGLYQQGTLGRRSGQIVSSLTVSTVSAAVALLAACGLRRQRRRWLTVAVLLPGLCGSLVLSMLLLAFFQLPVLNVVYDTWIPMIMGTALLLLPRAFLLAFLLEISSTVTTQHSAHLLTTGTARQAQAGRRLRWQLVQWRWLLALAMLTHWAFWDVTVASVLRPVRFEPVVTRLYNEMHYGRTESLIAMTFLAIVIPLLILCVAAAGIRFRPRMKKVNS